MSAGGALTYANRALRELLGIEVGPERVDFLATLAALGSGGSTVLEKAIPAARTDGLWRGDLTFGPAGRALPVSMVVLAHRRPDGDVEFISGIGRDIASRKRNEAALVAAREAAEAASQAKSQFVATMSHEIRTPLNGVIGTADLLALTRLTDTQRDLVRTLHESSEMLLAVINDILDFSKIEADRVEARAHRVRSARHRRKGRPRAGRRRRGARAPPAARHRWPRSRRRSWAIRAACARCSPTCRQCREVHRRRTKSWCGSRRAAIGPRGPRSALFEVCDTGIGISPRPSRPASSSRSPRRTDR